MTLTSWESWVYILISFIFPWLLLALGWLDEHLEEGSDREQRHKEDSGMVIREFREELELLTTDRDSAVEERDYAIEACDNAIKERDSALNMLQEKQKEVDKFKEKHASLRDFDRKNISAFKRRNKRRIRMFRDREKHNARRLREADEKVDAVRKECQETDVQMNAKQQDFDRLKVEQATTLGSHQQQISGMIKYHVRHVGDLHGRHKSALEQVHQTHQHSLAEHVKERKHHDSVREAEMCALRIELKGKSDEVESLREGLQSKHQQSTEDAQEIENSRSEVQRKEKILGRDDAAAAVSRETREQLKSTESRCQTLEAEVEKIKAIGMKQEAEALEAKAAVEQQLYQAHQFAHSLLLQVSGLQSQDAAQELEECRKKLARQEEEKWQVVKALDRARLECDSLRFWVRKKIFCGCQISYDDELVEEAFDRVCVHGRTDEVMRAEMDEAMEVERHSDEPMHDDLPDEIASQGVERETCHTEPVELPTPTSNTPEAVRDQTGSENVITPAVADASAVESTPDSELAGDMAEAAISTVNPRSRVSEGEQRPYTPDSSYSTRSNDGCIDPTPSDSSRIATNLAQFNDLQKRSQWSGDQQVAKEAQALEAEAKAMRVRSPCLKPRSVSHTRMSLISSTNARSHKRARRLKTHRLR